MRPRTVQAFALGVVFGGLIAASVTVLSAPAKADPDSASIAYAAAYGGIVCDTLDSYPTFNGIQGIADAIVESGLSYKQAGYVIALSVGDICPRHTSLILSFANQERRSAA